MIQILGVEGVQDAGEFERRPTRGERRWILTFRRDSSDRDVFDKQGTPRASKDQTTVLLGLIFVIAEKR